jgi:hypothetical protein
MTSELDINSGLLRSLTDDELSYVKRQIREKIRVWMMLGAITEDGAECVRSVLAGLRDGLELRARFASAVAEEVYNDNVRLGFVDGQVTDISPDGVDSAAYAAGREYAWDIKLPDRVCAKKTPTRGRRAKS